MRNPRFYVRREHPDGRHGWVGPLPAAQAEREAAAWRAAGCSAEIRSNDSATRGQVKAWQHAADKRHGRPLSRIPAADR